MPQVFNKQTLLLNSLHSFYNKKQNMEQLVQCLSHEQVSLRLLDYICTKYSKAKKIIYVIPNTTQTINIHTSYKDQLKAYSKMRFDPFRRHERILFSNGKYEIETTIAQLNFFKWVIDIHLFSWILQNITKVEKSMKTEMLNKKTRVNKK